MINNFKYGGAEPFNAESIKEFRRLHPDKWKNKGHDFTEEQIREAMKNSRSNKEAARWLDVAYQTYKRYAKKYVDLETGKTLLELHNNQEGRGLRKMTGIDKAFLIDLNKNLVEGRGSSPYLINKLKNALLKDGRLGFTCSCCGYGEKRVSDMKAPLMVDFKNGRKTDWRQENLRLVCYNCCFLLGLRDEFFSKMTEDSVQGASPENITKEDAERVVNFFDLEDIVREQVKKLGLEHSKSEPAGYKEPPKQDNDYSEFIDYI